MLTPQAQRFFPFHTSLLVHRLYPNVQPPNVQHCPQCATLFWAICVLPRVPNVQHFTKIILYWGKKLKIHMENTEYKANKIENHFLQKSRIDNCLVFFSIGSESDSSHWISWIRLGRTSSSKDRSSLRFSWASNIVENSSGSFTWSISEPTRPLFDQDFSMISGLIFSIMSTQAWIDLEISGILSQSIWSLYQKGKMSVQQTIVPRELKSY